MPLFQTSVINKYIGQLPKELLNNQYLVFKNYFLNVTIQQNIIAQKEEQFQEGFLRELFVKVLGYTINPEPNFNLTTELKNEKDSKKADGAIIDGTNVLGVIELKSTKTTDLNKIEIQAFNYKNNQAGCRYVITSNFHKIRFYIDNAIDFIEWDLFKLSLEDFQTMYLCLCKENILVHLPATIKSESISQEENITKQLYKEYSNFRKELFNNIAENNKQFDKLILFKKTQKLLDRFLFLFFAEDRQLVPPNSVRIILDQWKELKEKFDEYQPLYERFKKYFGYLNTGYVGKQHEIFAYNGGLFAPDEILDSIKIDDSILHDATLGLSNYDYNSEVDVNILGHIFEHSLTEIEELEKEITSTDVVDTKTSKRKKDGVFYTPKYITKYIVENTVGTLCKNKKEELNLQEEDYHKLTKKAKKQLYDNLMHYREWLLHITIIDPACGSGAFLNQALEFLIAEHRGIAELEANIFNAPMVFDVESSILENNLFGVDINEESVEIAKLSLWLRTARKGRKLNSLNNNIKCGNSLIDDPNVAGDKAFNWQEQFPHIFEKGGFDVVLGNPPYVRQEHLGNSQKSFFEYKYNICFNYSADLYVYFYSLSFIILKAKGLLGFITPNKWMERQYGFEMRNYLINFNIKKIINYGELKIFEDASTEPQIIIIENIQNCTPTINYAMIKTLYDAENYFYNFKEYIKENLNQSIWRFTDNSINDILYKFNDSKVTLDEYTKGGVFRGLLTGANEVFIIKQDIKNNLALKDINSNEILRKMVEGDDFSKWSLNHSGRYIIATQYDLDVPKYYPSIFEYLKNYEAKLVKRQDKGLNYWNLRACDYYDKLELPKLIYYHTAVNHSFYYDTEGYYISANCYFISNADRYLQCVLNSKLFNCVKKYLFPAFGDSENGGRVRLDANKMIKLPIKIISGELKETFQIKAESISSVSIDLTKISIHFQSLIVSKFENIKINTKLEKWYELSFADFNKELSKQKIKLSLSEQSEWLTFFEQEKQKALVIKNEIDKTDKEIDQMVYQLYGLTEEEIKIVEGK